MKARRSRRTPLPKVEGVKITRHVVETSLLVQFDELEHVEEAGVSDVEGALVKVAPRLKASERDTFDGPATARRFRELGALGVMLAPSIISDDVRKKTEPRKTLKPREAVAAWFEIQRYDAADVDAAIEIVHAEMGAEGL